MWYDLVISFPNSCVYYVSEELDDGRIIPDVELELLSYAVEGDTLEEKGILGVRKCFFVVVVDGVIVVVAGVVDFVYLLCRRVTYLPTGWTGQ